MRSRVQASLIAFLMVCLTSQTHADQVTFQDGYTLPDGVQAKIDPIVTAGGAYVHYFNGPSGLIGIGLTQTNGKQTVAFSTADGEVLIGGIAIDTKTQTNMSERLIAEVLPEPDLSGLVARVRNGSGVAQGNPESPNRFYVFVDPQCGFCSKTFDLYQRMLDNGADLYVSWIVVGTLGPSSENQASAILAQSNNRMLLLASLLNKTQIPVSPDDVATGQVALARNMELFRSMGFGGVPATVQSNYGRISISTGMPKEEFLTNSLKPPVEKQAAR